MASPSLGGQSSGAACAGPWDSVAVLCQVQRRADIQNSQAPTAGSLAGSGEVKWDSHAPSHPAPGSPGHSPQREGSMPTVVHSSFTHKGTALGATQRSFVRWQKGYRRVSRGSRGVRGPLCRVGANAHGDPHLGHQCMQNQQPPDGAWGWPACPLPGCDATVRSERGTQAKGTGDLPVIALRLTTYLQ